MRTKVVESASIPEKQQKHTCYIPATLDKDEDYLKQIDKKFYSIPVNHFKTILLPNNDNKIKGILTHLHSKNPDLTSVHGLLFETHHDHEHYWKEISIPEPKNTKCIFHKDVYHYW